MTITQEITKAPDCVTCGREIENSHFGPPWLTMDYWDCECEQNYIHPKTEAGCSVCGMNELEDGMPDSHVLEVIKHVQRPQCRECQKLPSGLDALMETVSETEGADREMKEFLRSRLSAEDYGQARNLIHRYRVLCQLLRERCLLDAHDVKISPEYRMDQPKMLEALLRIDQDTGRPRY